MKMSRLRKVALIGNIGQNDIEIESYPKRFVVKLINEEKALHKGEWTNPRYWEPEDEDELGGMSWQVYKNSDDNAAGIYIGVVEIRPEYGETRVLMMLLKKFEEEILNPLIEKYGKDNIILQADFANSDLEAMLSRVSEKKGLRWGDVVTFLDLNVGEDDDYSEEYDDTHLREDLIDSITAALDRVGLKFTFDGTNFIFKNQHIASVIQAINPRKNVQAIYGVIDSSGDIHYSPTFDYYEMNFPRVDGALFSYDEYATPNVVFDNNTGIETAFTNITNTANLKENLSEVFNGGDTFKYNGDSVDIDEVYDFIDRPRQQTASRLRKQ